MRQTPLSLIFQEIDKRKEEGSIPAKYGEILKSFFSGYEEALLGGMVPFESCHQLFITFLDLIKKQCTEPFVFQPYHHRVRAPFDYYQFGLEMLKPLIDKSRSSVGGKQNIQTVSEAIERGENIIFLANHQTEADPHAISILLEDTYPRLGEEMIFVAGERVITDPLAVPFSIGRNLLCIFSKRYIDQPPEDKLKKQLHNKRTMELMSELLSEGGKAVYVAPSGGRDRPNAEGIFSVAAYDPQSIEMFYLMAQRAGHPTHFYPMALKTYELLPPPQTIQVELGEQRHTKRAGIHIAIGKKIDMEQFPGNDKRDKHERRAARAEYICNLVKEDYSKFP